MGMLDGVARFLLIAGGMAALIGIILMVTSFFSSQQASSEQISQAMSTLGYFKQAAIFGTIAACMGGAWILWGEETAGPIMLIFGLALFFSPMLLQVQGNNAAAELQQATSDNLRTAGIPAVIFGFLLVIGDIIGRIKLSMREGARKEHMKYGQDIKEERDTRNVFMGKCWQLPYCRKFVRERCPIYHAKRTCWKERVGCMCEESVIKNAMEGKTIPKDLVGASKFIPKNNKLTPTQKAERCQQCVIYNQHQKHKYQLALPITAMTIGGVYFVMREPLGNAIKSGLMNADSAMDKITFSQDQEQTDVTKGTSVDGGVIPYHEIILFVIALVVLAYSIKVLEYFFFRVKA